MIFLPLRLDRLTACSVNHQKPDAQEQWQDVDELHLAVFKAGNELWTASGNPDVVLCAGPRHVETGPYQGTTTHASVVLRHLVSEAVTQMLAMGQFLRRRFTEQKQPAVLDALACVSTDSRDPAPQGLELLRRREAKCRLRPNGLAMHHELPRPKALRNRSDGFGSSAPTTSQDQTNRCLGRHTFTRPEPV